MYDFYEFYDYSNSFGFYETGVHPYEDGPSLAECETVVDYPITDM